MTDASLVSVRSSSIPRTRRSPCPTVAGIQLERIDHDIEDGDDDVNEILPFKRAAGTVNIGRKPSASGEPVDLGAASWRSPVMSRNHAKIMFSPSGFDVSIFICLSFVL
jgi:hypothetical protein